MTDQSSDGKDIRAELADILRLALPAGVAELLAESLEPFVTTMVDNAWDSGYAQGELDGFENATAAWPSRHPTATEAGHRPPTEDDWPTLPPHRRSGHHSA